MTRRGRREDTMSKIHASTNPNISEREQRNMERSKNIASMGMVLLENRGGLPLDSSNKKLALFGNGARRTVKGGSGSGDINSRKVLSIEEAITEAGYDILTTSWMDRYDMEVEQARNTYFEKIQMRFATEGVAAAMDVLFHPFKEPPVILASEEELKKNTNTAIYVLARNSGEGADRSQAEGDYELFPEEIELLEQILSSYENVIVVLNVGGVIDTNYLKSNNKIKALLLMSQGGCNGAEALVELLTGKVTPSGRLTTTWAANYSDYPCANTFSHMNEDTDDEYYNEGIYVGYRYFDTFNITPNYPFGYGKSYTSFGIDTLLVDADEESISLVVRVTNIGDTYSGKEVVQIYTSAPRNGLEKPYQELVAFAKTRELAPGESEDVSISFATVDLASYDEKQAAWIIEGGEYLVRVGNNSRNTKVVARIALKNTAVVKKMENQIPLDVKLSLLTAEGIVTYSYEKEQEEIDQAKVLVLDEGKFTCDTVRYQKNCKEIKATEQEVITMDDIYAGKASVEELVSQLTIREMAELCVGTARGGNGASSMVGMASNMVPGAAGDTASHLSQERKVNNLILADGPAGLRLSPSFAADAQNQIIPGTEVAPLSGFDFFTGQMEKVELPEDATTYYQYCTAIPIATLLAQTWDISAIEDAGDLVGEEMEEFGVNLWLAPGMNIHRNPLCGRNFEYYSEDPLIAGKCAAAETKGVQRHRGCATTIKHLACNNQEDNRTHTNAHISERALREIYLKGFEIAVKESMPKAIMTSYNLLNGIHTANNYDLITSIVRDEWNFEGLVMTDWGTTGHMEILDSNQKHKYGDSSAAGCIKAGNDLIMPGSIEDVEEIIRSVDAMPGEDGVACSITLAELQACAVRVVRTVHDMQR